MIRNTSNSLQWFNSIKHTYITNDRVTDLLKCLMTRQPTQIWWPDLETTPIRYGQYTVADLSYNAVRKNVQRLSQLTGKHILLHRANSLEKARIAMLSGFDGLELDLFYDPERDSLEVGHDTTAMSGIPLSRYLALLSNWNYKKLWLDIKNLDRNSQQKIFAKLTQFDATYALKNRTIIETRSAEKLMSQAQREGWFISYSVDSAENAETSSICTKIRTVRQQYLPSGLSFDITTYKAVHAMCPDAFNGITLNTRAVEDNSINTGNTLTPRLLKEDLMGMKNLDAVLIRMDTDADL